MNEWTKDRDRKRYMIIQLERENRQFEWKRMKKTSNAEPHWNEKLNWNEVSSNFWCFFFFGRVFKVRVQGVKKVALVQGMYCTAGVLGARLWMVWCIKDMKKS